MPHVAGEAESVQHGQQVKEGLVFGVVCPALDGHAIRCHWSVAAFPPGEAARTLM